MSWRRKMRADRWAVADALQIEAHAAYERLARVPADNSEEIARLKLEWQRKHRAWRAEVDRVTIAITRTTGDLRAEALDGGEAG